MRPAFWIDVPFSLCCPQFRPVGTRPDRVGCAARCRFRLPQGRTRTADPVRVPAPPTADCWISVARPARSRHREVAESRRPGRGRIVQAATRRCVAAKSSPGASGEKGSVQPPPVEPCAGDRFVPCASTSKRSALLPSFIFMLSCVRPFAPIDFCRPGVRICGNSLISPSSYLARRRALRVTLLGSMECADT